MRLQSRTMTLLPVAAFLATACSGQHRRAPTPVPSTAQTEEPDYALDSGGMNPSGSELSENGQPVVWTTRAVVDGTEVLKLQNATFAAVRSGLQNIRVKASQDVKLEFTLTGTVGTNHAAVLATNVATTAAADSALEAIWAKNCGSVSTDFDLLSGLNTALDAETGKASVDIQLCDFSGVLAAPTVQVAATAVVHEMHNIVYACQASNTTSYGDILHASGSTQCVAGYIPPSAAAKIDHNNAGTLTFEAPAGVSSHFQFAGDLDLNASGASTPSFQYKMMTDNIYPTHMTMPTADFSFCHTIEFQIAANAGTATAMEARVSFHRLVDPTSGAESWANFDQSGLPTPASFLAQTVPLEQFYLFCTWDNTVGKPVTSVTTPTF